MAGTSGKMTKKKPRGDDKGTSGNGGPQQRKTKQGTGLNDMFIAVFGVAFLLSLGLNILHGIGGFDNDGGGGYGSELSRAKGGNSALHSTLQDFKMNKNKKTSMLKDKYNIIDTSNQLETINEHDHNDRHQEHDDPLTGRGNHNEHDHEDVTLSTLNCDAFGGPSINEAQEMVYWADIPSDEHFISPFHPKRKHPKGSTEEVYVESTKYLTFEPDGGGWNNIRMAMESVIALAVAMGRTLVMPPQKKMYLLGKGDKGQRSHFDFADFFPIYEMAQEHIGLDVISMKEYLTREGVTGKLTNHETHKVEFPPGNRTDWNLINQDAYDIMRGYLRNVSKTAYWKPSECLPAFPKSGDHKDVVFLNGLVTKAKLTNELSKNQKPVDVDSTNVLARLEESLNKRLKLCVYDETLQNEKVVHFQMNHKKGLRLLVHFYGFIFFEDWAEDLWMKRFIRDHVRYIDEVQCAAARIVAAVRDHVRKRDPKNAQGIFDTFHIRRGDFQFKDTRIPATEILANSKDQLTPNSTIFIATDERDKKFFDPFREAGYDILFLDDFMDKLKDVNTNYYGMIDQLIASRGRIFFGCWHSTFTGYIMRLRGYHSQNQKDPGYEDGLLPTSYYYATLKQKYTMHTYSVLKDAFFNREFPVSWRNLNKGIGMLDEGHAIAATGR